MKTDGLQPLKGHELNPVAPYYFLAPKQLASYEEYERGYRLCEVMPLNSTAAVTARDHFLVAFDERELLGRLDEFCDPTISDEEIRRRYFTRTRSAKYLAGDTRGWRLSQARSIAAKVPDLRSHVRDLQYRPFDYRKIFWADWMIDWPRPSVMRHLRTPGNVALIARRQTPAGAHVGYFWVTETMVLDGLIRSDNRGSESMFPLWTNDGQRSANFSPAFVADCCRQWGLRWNDVRAADGATEFDPEDLLSFIYALFHCPSYRQRFADWLRVDFPRVLLPKTPRLFRQMSRMGVKLIELHLLRQLESSSVSFVGDSTIVERGCPRFADGRVWISPHAYFAPVTESTWQYQVGTYQVCRKWLKDRLGRQLSAVELRRYGQIVSALSQTQSLMQEMERCVTAAGGWEGAF
jgi:hypothetical protein